MSLLDHARAYRTLAEVFADELAAQTDEHLAMMAGMLSHGYRVAAERIEKEVRDGARATAEGHRCHVDHSLLKVAKCPACGAASG